MITVYCQQENTYTAELVRYGFIRSFTRAQVDELKTDADYVKSIVYVFVNPGINECQLLKQLIQLKIKIILLGTLSIDVARLIGVEAKTVSDDLIEWSGCEPAPVYGFSESEARIQYSNLPDGLQCFVDDRPLLRYDFAAEWNNHGYGAVRTDDSIWSLACQARITGLSTEQLAYIYKGESVLSAYVTLTQAEMAEILWVNRPVGLIDTHEFRLIETFICNYAPDRLTCLPLLREIPYGFDAMISMRLDCDESISSAKPLFEFYKERKIPFSLAIKTAQDTDEADYQLLCEVIKHGGSVLSHTVNHKSNWGVDMTDVRTEAKESKTWLLSHVKDIENVEYAISPFHQNPDYAVEALASEGYRGFVSGIICNDPQYLLSRAGEVYGVNSIVTHSQQCMMHGDCLLKASIDQLSIYKKSADICIKSGAIFGYLDHPFSDRYQYGWTSEEQRIGTHNDWIGYLNMSGRVLFENEAKTLNYVRKKASANIWSEEEVVRFDIDNQLSEYSLAYEYKDSVYRLN